MSLEDDIREARERASSLHVSVREYVYSRPIEAGLGELADPMIRAYLSSIKWVVDKGLELPDEMLDEMTIALRQDLIEIFHVQHERRVAYIAENN